MGDVWTVGDFVAALNQTLEFAYPSVSITGELANFRISKNRWVYFDLKDSEASLRCFGTVYALPGPLEDGMVITVRAQPRLHPQYGFSLQIQTMQVAGEGSLKRAADLLAAQLTSEGLFRAERKRLLPYPPQKIGLITSSESAAYADFIKVLGGRWGGLDIVLADVQVQGEPAPAQIVRAIERLNAAAEPPDVLVITRGGGSADDLAAFSTEQVVRAVAGSRIPTLVAIGHEIDTSLAELAADCRASTPSNAAELLVPDRRQVISGLKTEQASLQTMVAQNIHKANTQLIESFERMRHTVDGLIQNARAQLTADERLINALDPRAPLLRGYALIRQDNAVITRQKYIKRGTITIEFTDGSQTATIEP